MNIQLGLERSKKAFTSYQQGKFSEYANLSNSLPEQFQAMLADSIMQWKQQSGQPAPEFVPKHPEMKLESEVE